MNKPNKRGLIFENEVAEKLKSQGFNHVKVTKASRDYGADILAFKDGLDYVVQCKKYKRKVGFNAVKDIATAMDFYQADRGMLVCDTEFSKPAHIAVEKIDKPIDLIGLNEIKEWKSRGFRKIKYTPHRYQKAILSKLVRHRKQRNKSALLVMATGLGKTLVAAWDLKNQIQIGEKALFLVHRKDILVDNAEKFDAIINWEKDQFKFGIYFGGKRFDKKDDIIFSTFQTIIKYYKKIPKNFFDYIVIDEAHHSPAPSYAKVFSYFNPKFILGVTATPRRLTKSDNKFISDIFGEPLVDLDLSEALLKGYLSPIKYSVFCDNIDYGKLKTVNRKLSIEQLNKSYFIPTKDEDIEKLIKLESKKLNNPKTIIFCPNIKYINSIRNMGLFPDAEVYHSAMSDFERTIIFRRFKTGKAKTLLVVDLFNEGIDVPDASLIVFLRTTYSPTIFFQQLGRGLRKARDKKYLRVLDFVGALSKIKKIINVFGHLLIIQDFIEKVDSKRRLSNVYRGQKLSPEGILDPLDLTFYQAGKKVKHKESLFKRRDFLSEIRFLKKHLIKSEGWTEQEIINALKPICRNLGSFPSREYLMGIGSTDLSVQVARQGGTYYFATKLGYSTSQKPKKYWNSWENFSQEMLPICKKLGKMPTQEYLKKIGRGDLESAMLKVWGGTYRVGQKLGFMETQKPEGYWDKWRNFKDEFLPICNKLGSMPSYSYLRKIGRADFATPIRKFGGIFKVAERLGYKLKRKPDKYYHSFKNLKKALLPICKKLGKVPSSGYLKRMGLSNLANGIYHNGGTYKVAQKLGYPNSQKPKGYWNVKILKDELKPICKKLGKMPSAGYLRKIGRTDLSIQIGRQGGMYKIGKKLGYEVTQKPRKYWKDWENLKKELLPICKRLRKMPSTFYLLKLGRQDLLGAIHSWGGVFSVSKKIGYPAARKPNGYWKKWENIAKEIGPIYKKTGKMPSGSYLERNNKGDLLAAINVQWGGLLNVAKKLGYKTHR